MCTQLYTFEHISWVMPPLPESGYRTVSIFPKFPPHTPSSWQSLICSLSLSLCHFVVNRIIQDVTIWDWCFPFNITPLIHPGYCINIWFFFFWIAWHFLDVPQFAYPSTCCGTSWLISSLSNYELSCHKHPSPGFCVGDVGFKNRVSHLAAQFPITTY